MHDPPPKGMAHCSHSSIRAPQGPAHFPTVPRTVGTGRDADRPDVLFSSPMAHRVQLSRRLDKRKTPCFPARRLRGAPDWIRTSGLQSRSYQAVKEESQVLCGFRVHRTKLAPICKNRESPWRTWIQRFFQFWENSSQTVVRDKQKNGKTKYWYEVCNPQRASRNLCTTSLSSCVLNGFLRTFFQSSITILSLFIIDDFLLRSSPYFARTLVSTTLLMKVSRCLSTCYNSFCLLVFGTLLDEPFGISRISTFSSCQRLNNCYRVFSLVIRIFLFDRYRLQISN